MPLDTNFNVSPYFDDYSEDKNFHRVLFRPSVAVQARELTQLQTILQNQVERFGDNIFKTGTIIKGCALTTDFKYNYIKIKDTQLDGQPVSLGSYSNTLIIQESSNLQSFVVNYKSGLESQDPNLNTVYIKYQNTGTAGEKIYTSSQVVKVFNRNRRVEDVTVITGGSGYSNSDTITFSGGNGSGASAVITTDATGEIVDVSVQSKGTGYTTTPNVSITTSGGTSANLVAKNFIAELTVASVANSVGVGAAIKTTEGVIYQKGHFIRVDQQEEILQKYSNQPNNVVIGFRTVETVVNSNIDSSLLDLATGTPNFAAPGANRLKLTPSLIVLTKSQAESNNEFLSLLEYENGKVVKDRTVTQFNSVNRELSRRTFEESGNYVINTITLDTEDISGNTTHFNLVVGPGTAYVNGERIEIQNYIRKAVRKGNDTANTVNQTINTSYGSYVTVKELVGAFEIKEGSTVNLRSVAGTDVTDNAGGTPTAPGVVLGTAKVRALEYSSGTPGTSSCEYKLYLFDIRMSNGSSFKDVRSVSIGSTALADIVLVNGIATLKDIENDILVFDSGTFAVKELNQEEFIFRTSTNATFTTAGSVTISFSGGNTLPYGVGTLSDSDTQEFIVIPTNSFRFTANNPGTVASTSGQTNVTGTSTTFTTTYQVGDYIRVGTAFVGRVANIFSDTNLGLANNAGSSTSANAHFTEFPAFVPVDFTRGSRAVTVNSTTSITVDIGAGINVSSSFVMYHDLENFEPGVRSKTLNSTVYVKLSTDKLANTTTGPWCLGIPDVLSIDAVYIGSSNTYSNTSTNYASEFELDNGQRDNYYGLAYLSKAPGSTVSLTSSSSLLVKLRCFTHSSGKYISTESYPVAEELIPIYVSKTSGEIFSLRDSVDFRPIVANTATLSTTVGGASIDPSSTETLVAGEKFFPSPSRSFECTVQSYLPRVDRIVIGNDGIVKIIEGVSNLVPDTPSRQKGTMDLGLISVAPFPSLTSKAASDAKRPDLKNTISLLQTRRYTMKDIGDMESRLQRLEYYTLLNTLEANAASLTIPSEGNSSIEVFKNGFFVDPFDNYTIANINDGEFKAVIDFTSSKLVPQEDLAAINLKYSTGTNTTKNGDLVLLSFNEKELIKQSVANKERTLVDELWSFRGKMSVVPRYDNFFDVDVTATTTIDINIADPLTNLLNAQNEINARLTASSTLLGTERTETIRSDPTGRAPEGILTESIRQTFQDSRTVVTAPPVVTSTQDIKNLLTSVQVNPFVRAQKIGLYISGLRPGAQHYVYFDGEDLTSGSVPASITSFGSVTVNDFIPLFNKNTSPGLFANNTGELAVIVDIPADTFTAGEKDFLVMDVSNLSSETSATSKAVGKFASFSSSGTAQDVVIGTKTFDTTTGSFNARTFVDTRVVTTTREWDLNFADPLAQTFLVQKQEEGGDYLYLTSIDVYFKQKDSEKGVALELREVNDGGYPTYNVLPFSRVYKKSSEISVSNTGLSATKFTFSAPVAVKTEREYAAVLFPDGNSPDYRVWTAEAGTPDVSNTSIIYNQSWGLGTMFYSVTNRAFSAVQGEDIKFTVNRADFSNTSGTATLTNDDYEFLTISSVSGAFTGGERVAQMANSYVNVALTTNTTSYVINTNTSLTSVLTANDYVLVVYGTNNNIATANVKVTGISVTNSTSTTTDFTAEYANGDFIKIGNEVRLITNVASSTALSVDAPFNATITDSIHYSVEPEFDIFKVRSANTTSITVNRPPNYVVNNSVVASIQKVVSGTVNYYNSIKNKLYLADSNSTNSTFLVKTSNSTYFGYIVGDDSDSLAKVTSIDNISATSFTPLINTIQLPATTINMTGSFSYSNGAPAPSRNYTLDGRNNVNINDVAIVKSKSNEISGVSITKSLSTTLSFTTEYKDTSPVLDINPSSLILLKANINNDSADENTRFGNSQCKYVSKRLDLAEGLDAEDIKVFLKAYKPTGTDIEVYAKILNSVDNESFNDKNWSELEQVTSAAVVSSSLNENDLREYEYTFKRSPASLVIAGAVETFSNTTVEGFGTNFTADLTSNSIVKIVYNVSGSDYDIIPVSSITDANTLVLTSNTSSTGTGHRIEKVTKPKEAFKYNKNINIVRYFDSSRAAHDSYKFVAIKIVLLSSSTFLTPKVDDVRALAVSV